MNKARAAERTANVAVLKRNYPNVDATRLEDRLYRLALKCERNALALCNTANHIDQTDVLRTSLERISQQYGVKLKAEVTGDPRGYCLKLYLPDQSYNTWGGREAGYGIGSN